MLSHFHQLMDWSRETSSPQCHDFNNIREWPGREVHMTNFGLKSLLEIQDNLAIYLLVYARIPINN